jgi:hypothetical protein
LSLALTNEDESKMEKIAKVSVNNFI